SLREAERASGGARVHVAAGHTRVPRHLHPERGEGEPGSESSAAAQRRARARTRARRIERGERGEPPGATLLVDRGVRSGRHTRRLQALWRGPLVFTLGKLLLP